MTKLTIIMYHDIVNPDDIIYNKINIKHYKKFSAALTLQEFEFQLSKIKNCSTRNLTAEGQIRRQSIFAI